MIKSYKLGKDKKKIDCKSKNHNAMVNLHSKIMKRIRYASLYIRSSFQMSPTEKMFEPF